MRSKDVGYVAAHDSRAQMPHEAPAGALAEVQVTSVENETTIFHAVQVVGATGDVEITAEVAEASASGTLTITFTLSQGTRELVTREATLADD